MTPLIIISGVCGALGYAAVWAAIGYITRDHDRRYPRPTWAERRARHWEYRASRHHHLR